MGSTPYTGFISQRYVEPTICFTAEPLQISENYPLDKLPVNELVKKGPVVSG